MKMNKTHFFSFIYKFGRKLVIVLIDISSLKIRIPLEHENIGKYNIMQPLVLSAFLAIGMMVGFKMNDKAENSLVSMHDYPKDSMMMTGRVEELIRFIDSKYVEKINSDQLIDEAVHAIFAKLDPHSLYLSPEEAVDAADQMDGAYNGIGIENFMIDDTVNISNVLDNGPAKAAGLKAFDKILEIDHKVVAGKKLDYSDIRSMLRKESGRSVDIKVLRDGKILPFNLKVDEVPVHTVTSSLMPEINTAHIRIERFGSNTYKEFMEAIEKHFKNNQAKHLILDLRDNPGGYLPEATNILCQIFEEKDKLLLYTEGRNSKRNEYKSNGKRFFPIDKVVVLIDENSASASEIIAGAIQDWDRGIIVGRRSYGKGLVQEQYDLNNGGAVRLTVARYFTPSGRSIQRDYTNRFDYDEDLNSRYVNGDLFHKDSSLVKNGGKYYTQILKREVSGAGGITPDEFIALPEVYKNESSFEIKSYIPEFVFRYLTKNKNKFPKDYTTFQSTALPTNIFSEFEIFLNSNMKVAETNGVSLSGFELEIKQQITTFLYRGDKDKKTQVLNDPYVEKATSIISSDKKVADYKK